MNQNLNLDVARNLQTFVNAGRKLVVLHKHHTKVLTTHPATCHQSPTANQKTKQHSTGSARARRAVQSGTQPSGIRKPSESWKCAVRFPMDSLQSRKGTGMNLSSCAQTFRSRQTCSNKPSNVVNAGLKLVVLHKHHTKVLTTCPTTSRQSPTANQQKNNTVQDLRKRGGQCKARRSLPAHRRPQNLGSVQSSSPWTPCNHGKGQG